MDSGSGRFRGWLRSERQGTIVFGGERPTVACASYRLSIVTADTACSKTELRNADQLACENDTVFSIQFLPFNLILVILVAV